MQTLNIEFSILFPTNCQTVKLHTPLTIYPNQSIENISNDTECFSLKELKGPVDRKVHRPVDRLDCWSKKTVKFFNLERLD